MTTNVPDFQLEYIVSLQTATEGDFNHSKYQLKSLKLRFCVIGLFPAPETIEKVSSHDMIVIFQ